MTTYDDIAAMNQSTLKKGLLSMAHLKAKLDGERDKETPSMFQGTALHCRLFEPRRFAAIYRCMPEGNRGTKTWKADMAELKEASPKGAIFLPPKMWIAVQCMSVAVCNHVAVQVVRSKGRCEQTLTADLCGVPCKGRVDKLIMEPATVLDVKTCVSSDEHDIRNAIWNYRYDFQAAFYCDLAEAIHGKPFIAMMIFIESSYPYDVCVKTLGSISLAVGKADYEKMLFDYTKCKASGEWPGRSDKIEQIDLPGWKLRQFEQFQM